ncbi:MAG: hypothetical protein ACRENH_06735 [Gemmatimonadaceae bacterium]
MIPIFSTALRSRKRAAIIRYTALVAGALLSAACPGSSDSKSSTEPEGPSGVYLLKQVDAAAPPVTIHEGPWFDRVNTRFYNQLIMQVVDGTVELEEDGAYTLDFDLKYFADGTPGTTSVHREGDYQIHGEDIAFRYGSNPPGTFLGRLQGNVLTIPIDFMGKGVSNAYAFKR